MTPNILAKIQQGHPQRMLSRVLEFAKITEINNLIERIDKSSAVEEKMCHAQKLPYLYNSRPIFQLTQIITWVSRRQLSLVW